MKSEKQRKVPNSRRNLDMALQRLYGAGAMMPQETTTLHIEKFGEEPVTSEDAQAALDSAVAFAKAEFATGVTVERLDEKIPHTRAPYHVTFLVKVDASKRVAELAA